MLYLAEVKKQTRSFMGGGLKTELKLLACQHNDQTWSAIHGDEGLSSEAIDQLGEGALVVLNLNQNRQIQDKPELAGPELVRQLQKLSRLSEKLKEQREEIDQWKQSLTYQSQELSRRELELESRLEQAEEMENEFRQIDSHRKEIEINRRQVAKEQEKVQQFRSKFGDLLNFSAEQAESFRELVATVQYNSNGGSIGKPITNALTIIEQQQDIFNHYWQELNQQRGQLAQQQQAIERQRANLQARQEELEATEKPLTEAKLQFEIQKSILANKKELLNRLNHTLEANEELYRTINRLATGTEENLGELKLNLEALESMPLGELEENVDQLQTELGKLVQFVNDQEEELTLQCQAVQELETKLAQANDYDRLAIETELEEERECKGMLDETLIGQRRTLKERQEIFLQYLRILRRRQGVMELEDQLAAINWNAIFNPLQEVRYGIDKERRELGGEITYLQQSLGQIQEQIEQLDQDYRQKLAAIRNEDEQWQQSKLEMLCLQSRLQVYEETLQPLQDRLDEIRPNIEELSHLFGSIAN